jgi:hypothetical protein
MKMADKNSGARNRKAAEAFVLKYIEKLMPGSENTRLYQELFASMDDKQFEELMSSLAREETTLAVIAPNFGKVRLTVENNLKIAQELGHNFFEHLWIKPDDQTPAYLTPVKYLVIDLPLRRQAQLLVKKISIPADNQSVDDLTGQPSGQSEAAKISYPETQVLAALNLDKTLNELLKYRGGDTQGFNAMNDSFAKTGGASQDAISHMAGGVRSTQTLHTVLLAMHLSNSLTT